LDLDAHLAAIAVGDTDAFGRWVAGAEAPLRAALRSFAARVDTEAILQEALLRVWQVAPRVVSDGKPNALLRFAFRVAKNRALSELRRARVNGMDEEKFTRLVEQESEALAMPPPDPMLRRAFFDCRRELPEKPAAALSARLEASGEADETLAANLGMRANTFLQNFTRAKKMLADCLSKKGITFGAAP
jgi:DNA-directed RNA polymerase specialized sigma24 family protein